MPAMRARTAPAEMTLMSAACTGVLSSIAAIASDEAITLTMRLPRRTRRRLCLCANLAAETPRTSPDVQDGDARLSRRSGVPGLARQHAEVDADLLQRLYVFVLGVLAKDQVEVCVAVQPAVLVDLAFKLAGRPAGIAEREHCVQRAAAGRYGREEVERRGETHAVVDRQRRILDEKVARMQHEATARLDRPALEHLDAIGVRRKLNWLVLANHVQLLQEVAKIDIRGGLVDDDTHRAFG